jgi:hypothetical protein
MQIVSTCLLDSFGDSCFRIVVRGRSVHTIVFDTRRHGLRVVGLSMVA